MFEAYNREKVNFEKKLFESFEENYFEDILSYSVKFGKRIRPILLIETYKMISDRSKLEIAYKFAIALELIHNYSLVHDDLPSMDNDNYRRGRETTHYKFGEDMAILAGDALLNRGFDFMLAAIELDSSINILKASKYLSMASGYRGMILGQIQDIKDEIDSLETMEEMYRNKTCRLMMAATSIAGLIANVSQDNLNDLENLGYYIGMAFQLQDDVLDQEKDDLIDKKTYINIRGLEQTRLDIEIYIKKATDIINKYENNEFLLEVVKKLKNREF